MLLKFLFDNNRILARFFLSKTAALLAIAPATVLAAQDQQVYLPTEEDILGDIPVVLSATRLAQPRSDAPAAVTIIDRAMIEASGLRSVPELMRLVPGFQAGHDSGTVLAPQQTPVTYLGYSDAFSRKMQVLIDGRSVYEPFLGGVRWSELGLLLDDIERIEVVRGPNGASYGSNAVLGAINIITRHPATEGGSVAGMDVNSENMRQGTYRFGENRNKYSYRISTFYREDTGFDGRYDSKDAIGFSYRGESKLSNSDSLDYFLGHNQGNRQLGDGTADYPDHDGSVNSNYQQIKWSRRRATNDEASVQFYHNYFEFNNRYVGDIGAPTTFDATSKIRRWDVEFQRVNSLGSKNRLVWGVGVRVDEANAPGWLGTSNWVRNQVYRLFANNEWRPSADWTINAGALLEHSSVAESTFSPRLAINRHLGDGQTVRVAASRGYRNPALFEEHADTWVWLGDIVGGTPVGYFYSDGTVKAADVTNFEVGYLREAIGGKVTIDAKLFLMQFRNSISYPYGGTYLYTYINGGEANIHGVEFQLKYAPSPRTNLALSYAFARHDGWYVSILPSTTEISDGSTPNHTVSLLVDHRLAGNWSAGLFYHYVSNVDWFSGNPDLTYQIVNARLARKIHLAGRQGSVEIVGQNLAGDFADLTSNAVSRKKLFIGVRLPF